MIAGKMGHYSAKPNYVSTKDWARLAEANCRGLQVKIIPIFLTHSQFFHRWHI
jgi:hypothetical protein